MLSTYRIFYYALTSSHLKDQLKMKLKTESRCPAPAAGTHLTEFTAPPQPCPRGVLAESWNWSGAKTQTQTFQHRMQLSKAMPSSRCQMTSSEAKT